MRWRTALADGGRSFRFQIVGILGDGSRVTQSVVVNVLDHNVGPQFTNVASWLPPAMPSGNTLTASAYAGSTLTFTAQAADPDVLPNGAPDQASLVYSLVLPSSMNGGDDSGQQTATINSHTGSFTWTPPLLLADHTVTFQVVVTDHGGLSACETVSVSVQEPPTLGGLATWSVSNHVSDAMQVPAPDHWPAFTDIYDSSLPRDNFGPTFSLSFPSGSTLSSDLSIDPITGVMTWEPSSVNPPAAGDYPVVVTLSDGVQSASQSLDLKVTTRSAPYFLSGASPVYNGGIASAQLVQAEATFDPSMPIPAAIDFVVAPIYAGSAQNLSYSLRCDPTFTYAGGATLYSADGAEHFQYIAQPTNHWSIVAANVVVSDTSGDTATMRVVISVDQGNQTVSGVYAVPTAVAYQSPSTAMGLPTTGFWTGGIEKTYNITAQPAHGTITEAPNFSQTGEFYYTPDSGFCGVDTLQFKCDYTYLPDPYLSIAPKPVTGTTNVATFQIVVGPVVRLTVNNQQEVALAVNSGSAGSQNGMPLVNCQRNAAPAPTDRLVKTATLTITNPWSEPYSGYWTLGGCLAGKSTTFASYVHVFMYSGGTYTELFPGSSEPISLPANGSKTVQLLLEGMATETVDLSATLSSQLDQWQHTSPPALPSAWYTLTLQVNVVGPVLRFQGMTAGEEAAGQVGFVKLDNEYYLGRKDAQSQPLADDTATSPLPASTTDPNWAAATLEIASAPDLTAAWELNIPAGLRVWQQVGGQWVAVTSNTYVACPSNSGAITLGIEGMQLGTADLTANVHYTGTGIDVTYSTATVNLQVVSDSLAIDNVTLLDIAKGDDPAKAAVDSGYEPRQDAACRARRSSDPGPQQRPHRRPARRRASRHRFVAKPAGGGWRARAGDVHLRPRFRPGRILGRGRRGIDAGICRADMDRPEPGQLLRGPHGAEPGAEDLGQRHGSSPYPGHQHFRAHDQDPRRSPRQPL